MLLYVSSPQFILIGSGADAVTSRLKLASASYKRKRLDSSPKNWKTIVEILRGPDARAVIARLNSFDYSHLAEAAYEDGAYSAVAKELFEAIKSLPNIVFVHEQVYAGDRESYDRGEAVLPPSRDRLKGLRADYVESLDFDWEMYEAMEDADAYRFAPPNHEDQEVVNRLLAEYGINIAQYARNVEMEFMANSWVDSVEKPLLFRIYIPTGKLWADEVQSLLDLFSDWLSKVKHVRVRQDGYQTGAGAVVELLSEDITSSDLTTSLQEFSAFLDICANDSDTAAGLLTKLGQSPAAARQLAAKYAKRAQRLRLDLRHERESRTLEIRHELEAELVELGGGDLAGTGLPASDLDRLIQAHVPAIRSALPTLATVGHDPQHSLLVTINNTTNATIHRFEGVIAASISGSVDLSTEARQLIDLIALHGNADREALTTAVYELEDEDAPPDKRALAKARLRTFLSRVGGAAGNASLEVLKTWVQSKLGKIF